MRSNVGKLASCRWAMDQRSSAMGFCAFTRSSTSSNLPTERSFIQWKVTLTPVPFSLIGLALMLVAMARELIRGRVELVGKHVDYAGGRSLTCAVDRALTATVLSAVSSPLTAVDISCHSPPPSSGCCPTGNPTSPRS